MKATFKYPGTEHESLALQAETNEEEGFLKVLVKTLHPREGEAEKKIVLNGYSADSVSLGWSK